MTGKNAGMLYLMLLGLGTVAEAAQPSFETLLTQAEAGMSTTLQALQ